MALMQKLGFKISSWRGIRVRVPRPIISASFDEVRSDLSIFYHLIPFRICELQMVPVLAQM